MKNSVILRAILGFLLVSLKESMSFVSYKWPEPANKIPTDLDLSSRQSTYNYVYSMSDNSHIYIALNNIVFRSIRYEGSLLWTARNYTEYATQVLFSHNYMLTLLLLDENLKHFKIYGSELVEFGLNELPTTLYTDFRFNSYEYEYAPITNGHMFRVKPYYRFRTVRSGEEVVFTASTPEECAYLVSITGDNLMTLLQLNGEIKQFKLLDNSWTLYTPDAELSKVSKEVPSQDRWTENENLIGGVKTYSHTFKDSPNLAEDNARLRNALGRLEDELSGLKQDYDQFRSRVSSFDNSIERLAEYIFFT